MDCGLPHISLAQEISAPGAGRCFTQQSAAIECTHLLAQIRTHTSNMLLSPIGAGDVYPSAFRVGDIPVTAGLDCNRRRSRAAQPANAFRTIFAVNVEISLCTRASAVRRSIASTTDARQPSTDTFQPNQEPISPNHLPVFGELHL